VTKNTLVKADTLSVTGDIFIETGAELAINAGTTVLFEGPYEIEVEGSLRAKGTAAERIIFTSFKPSPVDDYLDQGSSWKGIVFDKTLSTNDSSIFEYCVFEYAKTIDTASVKMKDYLGGALFVNRFSKLYIENSIFRYNTAFYGSAIAAVNGCQIRINNNLFYSNYAYNNGPAAYLVNSYPYIYNNTIIDNVITDLNPDYQMGVIYAFRSKPYLENNIIRDNATGAFPQVYFYKEFYMRYNNISGFSGFNGNIDKDPLFDSGGEFPGMLTKSSPCIDAGTEGIYISQPLYDLAGNFRTINGITDIGAFEDQTANSIENQPQSAQILKIYPNPANPSAKIIFSAEKPGSAEITVYGIKGDKVLQFRREIKKAGEVKADIDMIEHTAGLYFVKVKVDNNVMTGKFLLIK